MLVVTLVLAACAGIYAWTTDFPMVFDDEMYLVNNPLVKSAHSFAYPLHFAEFATGPSRLRLDRDLATNFILRPFAYATFYLNYRLDGFTPRWFRVTNIAIHAGSALLVQMLVLSLMRRATTTAGKQQPSAAFVAGLSAMLFAVHPLATESVTYIVQRFTSLGTFLYLASLVAWFAAFDAGSDRARLALKSAAVATLVAGMLTKEIVFTAPLMAVVLDIAIRRTPLREALRNAMPLLACLPFLPGLVAATAMAQNPGSYDLRDSLNIVNSLEAPVPHWDYVMTQITVVAEYLRRILCPTDLNIDPDWPVYHSLFDGAVLVALVKLAVFAGSVVLIWRWKPHDIRTRLAAAFAAWYFITVSVSSGMVPLPDMMADHRTYLPSIGILVTCAALLDLVRASTTPRLLVPGLAGFAIIGLGCAALKRNTTWRSPTALWLDAAGKSSGKHRVWGNLGTAYSREGDEESAARCFREAVRIEPGYRQGLFNLANSLFRLGRPQESLEASLKLLRLSNGVTDSTVAYLTGLALAECGHLDEAIRIFKDILVCNPEDVRCHTALGVAYINKGNPALALTHFRNAAGIAPPDAELQSLMQGAESAILAGVGLLRKPKFISK